MTTLDQTAIYSRRPVRQANARGEGFRQIGFALAWLLVMSVPWGDMIVLPYDIQASRVLSVVTALTWVLILWSGRSARNLRPLHWFLLLFVTWAAINVMWTLETDRGLRRSLSYIQLFLVVWLIHQAAVSQSHYYRLMQAYIVGSWVAIIGVFVNFSQDIYLGDGRYTAAGLDPNDLAVTLAVGVPFAWHLNVHSGELRWLNRLYIPAAVVSVLLTASRSGLITLGIASLFVIVSLPRFSRKTTISLVAVVGLSALVVAVLWNEISIRRLSTIIEQLTARDLNGRVEIWQRGVDAFLERPLTGVGAGGFGAAVGAMRSKELAAHNTFLGILVEHGMIGFVLFGAAVISLIAGAWRATRDLAKLWTFVGFAWFVAVLTLSWENKEVTWVLFGLGAGIPRGLNLRTPVSVRACRGPRKVSHA